MAIQLKAPTGQNAPPHVLRTSVLSFFGLLLIAVLAIALKPFNTWLSTLSLGRLPIQIVWFGAMGGSLASLTGLFWHYRGNWSDSFDLWHMMRPWTGLVMGSLGAYLLLISSELATTSNSGSTAHSGLNPGIFYVTSFICGNAEASFRALVKRLTDTIFGPGNSPPKVDHN